VCATDQCLCPLGKVRPTGDDKVVCDGIMGARGVYKANGEHEEPGKQDLAS
jgi:hypothetical protein